MPVVLPLDADGKLIPFDDVAIAALELRRRGIRSEHDHWQAQNGPDGNSCTRRYSCAWDQRFQALLYMVGAVVSYIDPGDSKRKISRLPPQTDPDNPTWICTKCEITPWRFLENLDLEDVVDPDDGDQVDAENPGYLAGTHTPVFDRAELKCTFEQSPFKVLSDAETEVEKDRYVTPPGYPTSPVSTEASYIGLNGSIINYTTPSGAASPKGVPIPYPVGFVEPGRKVSIVWHRLPRDCWGPESASGAALFQRVIGTGETPGHLGSVNETTFFGMWSTTLLLIGVEEQLLPDPTGLDYSWTIKFVFQHKPTPYGHFGFFWHTLDASPTNPAGYYQALRAPGGTVTIDDPADIDDGMGLFNVREFDELFVVGDI